MAQYFKGQPVYVEETGPATVRQVVTNQTMEDWMGGRGISTDRMRSGDVLATIGLVVQYYDYKRQGLYTTYVDVDIHTVVSLVPCVTCGYVDTDGLRYTDQVHEDHCCGHMVCSETDPAFLFNGVCMGHDMEWSRPAEPAVLVEEVLHG